MKHRHKFLKAGLSYAEAGSSTPFKAVDVYRCPCGKFKDKESQVSKRKFGGQPKRLKKETNLLKRIFRGLV